MDHAFPAVGSAIVLVIIVVFFVVLFVLGVLLPFFVYGIWARAKAIENKLIQSTAMLTELTVEQEKANKLSEELLSEQEATNDLSRQLLRSYGHEPEA